MFDKLNNKLEKIPAGFINFLTIFFIGSDNYYSFDWILYNKKNESGGEEFIYCYLYCDFNYNR